MTDKFLSFSFEVKEASDSGIIEGYSAVFNNIDFGDDIIEPGAFKKTIKEKKGKWPVLWQHDPSVRIGINLEATEDDYGLKIREQLNLESPKGKEEIAFAKMSLEHGLPFGMSIGYRTIKATPDKERPSVRRLQELKMWEHSHVTFPMNDKTLITAAKSWNEQGDLGLSAMTDLFFKHMESIGHGHKEVMAALQSLGAAKSFTDPNSLVQSMDRTIQLLRGKS